MDRGSAGRNRMSAQLLELEGTWEEIAARASEFEGRRVRLIVLPEEGSEPFPDGAPEARLSTAASLLRYAGTWAGGDGEALLKEVYATRSRARF
jgi:hypothetical protein